mmetsp:Transcript_38952/g.92189  ORF Transcript_38952/g.92189 Transcript_38952/m.92189 type:complete len:249 (-) Transcript_38952:329-1075(-)
MFQMKMQPSSPTVTTWRSSGEKVTPLMLPECPMPLVMGRVPSTAHNRTAWSLPPEMRNCPEGESETTSASAVSSVDLTGRGSRRSQRVKRRSCPTDTICTWSASRAIALTPPMRCRREATRFSCLRSQHKMFLSFDDVTACESSSMISIQVTAALCSLRCETISRDLMSHTRTSPSSPPVMKKRWLCETRTAVTPARWVSATVQSSSPVSPSKHRSWPSVQPVIKHSSANAMHVGDPPLRHVPLQSTR